MTLVRAENLGVVRDGNVILENISLDVRKRAFTTVIGPNGAGKSFLIRCLCGFETYQSGKVTHAKNLRLGYMPQRLAPEKTLPITAESFIRLRKKFSKAEYDSVIEKTEVGGFLTRPLYALSGGELQRVLLARAILGEPDLLILDEPAQNLDVTGQLKFYALLEEIYRERDIAIVMVSHDLHLVSAGAKEVICLYKHICCQGAPHSVADDPKFIALFGEKAARMTAIYRHNHDHAHDESCNH